MLEKVQRESNAVYNLQPHSSASCSIMRMACQPLRAASRAQGYQPPSCIG